jgi:hydroxyacylglutathione hydrolase
MDLSITPIPAFTDNYFWLLERGGMAVVVDPGDAAPVERALADRRLALAAILVTHHHFDHIGGLKALTARHPVPVYGPAAEQRTIGALTHALKEGDRVRLDPLDLDLQVWEVPGHTLGHIAYVGNDPRQQNSGAGFVLCGDTLFSAGCGRLFEGTAAQLYRSLGRLAALPPATRVYCTHETSTHWPTSHSPPRSSPTTPPSARRSSACASCAPEESRACPRPSATSGASTPSCASMTRRWSWPCSDSPGSGRRTEEKSLLHCGDGRMGSVRRSRLRADFL